MSYYDVLWELFKISLSGKFWLQRISKNREATEITSLASFYPEHFNHYTVDIF